MLVSLALLVAVPSKVCPKVFGDVAKLPGVVVGLCRLLQQVAMFLHQAVEVESHPTWWIHSLVVPKDLAVLVLAWFLSQRLV